jgi:hypothetical protein
MIPFLLAAVVMLLAVIPLGLTAWWGSAMEAVVAYEAVSSVVLMVLVLLPEGFQRSSLFEFPVLMAVLLLGSGLVFVHALERWL